MDLENKKVLVVGLGKTGVASIQFLLSRGAEVVATDIKTTEELAGPLKKIEQLKVKVDIDGHRDETFLNNDLIVVSPGVPLTLGPVKKAIDSGIEVISEIELAYRYVKKPIIAVTGTNGKTTTTTLIAKILEHSGKKVFLGGNIGFPLISCVDELGDKEYIVAELSSFQLEGVSRFRAHISIILNFSEDHLDRYENFQEYVEAKSRILLNQQSSDYAIFNADDQLVLGLEGRTEAGVCFFGEKNRGKTGIYGEKDVLFYRGFTGVKEEFSLLKTKLKGKQNCQNIMAAVMAAKICGCSKGDIQEAIDKFSGLEHRMEFVGEVEQVDYYNDSKATNVGAVIPALASFREPVILIAGGRDKGLDFEPLKDLVQEKVKLLILLGEAKEKIFRVMENLTEISLVSSLDEAVILAKKKARPKDVVLLSPGCASFDMFSGYEARGRFFKKQLMVLVEDGKKN